MDSITTIASVLFAAGVIGGLMNYFISTAENSTNMPWWQHIVIGIGAAFMVPLFLNMISSGLIKDITGSGSSAPGDKSKLLVLGGLALVASVSARAFIRSLTDKILQQVKEAKSEAHEAKSTAREAKTQASTALDVLDEKDSQDVDMLFMESGGSRPDQLSANELKLLTEMTTGKYAMRSISGLSKDTGIEKNSVNIAMSLLMEKGLVEQGRNSKDQLRWYASPYGRSISFSAVDDLDSSSELHINK